MISPTFFQELFTGNIQGGFASGRGTAKQGEGAGSGFSTIFDRLVNDSKGSPGRAALGRTLPSGHLFLEQLKRALMASGVSLETNRVGADAMAEFGKLLLKAGFNRQEVQGMMSDLTAGSSGAGVSLATLFANASQLSKPDEDGNAPVLLEISTLPYIETILGRLGMDSESIRSVLADAKLEGSGIDIGTLAANIRRAMAAESRLAGTVSEDPGDLLGMMHRIGLMENISKPLMATLDKMISDLSRLNGKKVTSAEKESTEGAVPGNLLIPYLQQLAASLGDGGKELRQMIDSAKNDDGGLDSGALLGRLARMRQELSAAPAASAMTALAGDRGQIQISGEMSLSQFVSALETRISVSKNMHDVLKRGGSGQSTAQVVESFLDKISPDPSVSRGQANISTVLARQNDQADLMMGLRQAVEETNIGGKGRNGLGQTINNAPGREGSVRSTDQAIGSVLNKISSDPDGPRGASAVSAVLAQQNDQSDSMRGVRQAAGKANLGENGRGGQGQHIVDTIRQVSPDGEAGRNGSGDSSGKDEATRFMGVLEASGKERAEQRVERNLSAGDTFIRTMKSAEAVSASGKMPANRTLPGYLLDQVSRQLVRLRGSGGSEITLQLKPPHLGRMKLNIEHASGGIKVGIVVDNAATKEMLLSHSSELKAALGDQGLRLDKIHVETRNDFGGSMAQTGQEFSRSGAQGGWRTGRGMMVDSGLVPEGVALQETPEAVDTGRLNLVV